MSICIRCTDATVIDEEKCKQLLRSAEWRFRHYFEFVTTPSFLHTVQKCCHLDLSDSQLMAVRLNSHHSDNRGANSQIAYKLIIESLLHHTDTAALIYLDYTASEYDRCQFLRDEARLENLHCLVVCARIMHVPTQTEDTFNAGILLYKYEQPNTLYIDTFCVFHEFRNLGIGTNVIEALVEALQKSCPHVRAIRVAAAPGTETFWCTHLQFKYCNPFMQALSESIANGLIYADLHALRTDLIREL